MYLLYYAEACDELAGTISESLCSGNIAFFEENAVAVMSRRQHCVRFDQPEI